MPVCLIPLFGQSDVALSWIHLFSSFLAFSVRMIISHWKKNPQSMSALVTTDILMLFIFGFNLVLWLLEINIIVTTESCLSIIGSEIPNLIQYCVTLRMRSWQMEWRIFKEILLIALHASLILFFVLFNPCRNNILLYRKSSSALTYYSIFSPGLIRYLLQIYLGEINCHELSFDHCRGLWGGKRARELNTENKT